MAWDDLNDNGISDLVEDQLLKMEMRGLDSESSNSAPTSQTTSHFEASTAGSTAVGGGIVFGWIKDSIKYASKRQKKAMIIAGVVIGTITALGMAVAFLLY